MESKVAIRYGICSIDKFDSISEATKLSVSKPPTAIRVNSQGVRSDVLCRRWHTNLIVDHLLETKISLGANRYGSGVVINRTVVTKNNEQ